MPKDPTFREAHRDDVPAIIRLLADDALGRTRETWNEADNAKDLDAYVKAFEAIDQDPNNRLIVADLDGRVVGCMQLTAIPHLTFKGGTRLQIEGVRVDNALRGQKIGALMIEWAIDAARAEGCHLVQLTSNKSRGDALRFYESLGFEPTHVGFKRYMI